MDFDLEEAEALVNAQNEEQKQEGAADGQKNGKDEKKSKKKKHHKSKSRSRSGKKKSKKHKSKSRSRSGKKKHNKHRSKSSAKDQKEQKEPKEQRDQKEQSKSKEQKEQKAPSKSPEKVVIEEPVIEDQNVQQLTQAEQIELKRRELELQIEKLNKEAEEAQREDMTVMMYSIPHRADEKDIWRYLTKHCNISKVRDIKLIRDQKTKKSKGVAYAEFYIREDVDKALASDTKPFFIKGEEVPFSEVRFSPSYAEKNRAAVAAKLIKQQRAEALKEQLAKLSEGPVKIFVGGLNGKLAEMTSQDLKDIFQQYGEIESVDLALNPQGVGQGYAYIVYKKKSEAHEAIQAMNGFKIQDQQISCTPVGVNLSLTPTQPFLNSMLNDKIDLDQNENNIYLHSTEKRLQLMMKLAGNNISLPGLDSQITASQSLLPTGMQNIPSLNIAQNQVVQENFAAGNRPPTSMVPTNYVALINMFSENDFNNDHSFFADLKEDVILECKKYKEFLDVFVAMKSPCGAVFVIFSDPASAVACTKSMDGRKFNGRPISCYCISEDTLQEELQKTM